MNKRHGVSNFGRKEKDYWELADSISSEFEPSDKEPLIDFNRKSSVRSSAMVILIVLKIDSTNLAGSTGIATACSAYRS